MKTELTPECEPQALARTTEVNGMYLPGELLSKRKRWSEPTESGGEKIDKEGYGR